MMVRDFQSVVGREAREQFKEMTGGKLPDNLVACVGGGCNAIGLFTAFLEDEHVRMFGVEPSGTDLTTVGGACCGLFTQFTTCSFYIICSPQVNNV